MQLLSIGTLVAYTKVSISVLVSRFQSGVQSVPENDEGNTNITQWLHKIFSKAKGKESDPSSIAYQRVPDEEDTSSLPEAPGAEVTEATTFRAELAVFFLVIFLAALALILSNFYQDVFIKGEWWAIFLVTLFSGAIVFQLFVIQLQPRNCATFPFMVPGVPYISALTIFINALLMANLQWMTYVRFGVWMILGACPRSLSRESVGQKIYISQSVSRSVFHSVSRSHSPSVIHSVLQSVSQSFPQSDSESISQRVYQSISPPISPSVSGMVGFSVSQSNE